MENPTMTLEPRDELLWLWNTKEIRRPENSLDQKYYWNKIFIVVCLFAILTDPLFLYIPILKDDIKCLMLDRKLKIVVLLLRSLTDLFYLMDIIIRIYRSKNYSGLIVNLNCRQHQLNLSFVLKSCLSTIAKATTCVSIDILIDIVALLPLSQVAILIFFSKMSDLRSLTTTRMVLMNIFALLQYVPRVLRIYLLSKELKNKPLKKEITVTPIWIKGVLNFYMYIIASHVVGAMWYFFAIQRMMICWHSACRKDDGCDNRIFGCHDHHFFRNTTILNGLCPVSVSDNSSNTIFFDFGIFATVLQYGVVGSTNYFQKFLNCFWWGLRNLSSFGSNLEPSVNGWENLYSVCITTTGLLLFLYLLGNLQMYMQFETTRREDHKRKMLIKQKMEEKGPEIDLWLFKNGIPTGLIKNKKLQIMKNVQQALEMRTNTNLDNIIPLLPSDVQSRIKEHLAWLKQVPMLRRMDEGLLQKIYQQLEPVKYTDDTFIYQKDQPLDKMLYIVDGFVSIEEGSSNDSRRGAGQLCGQELLRWPFYLDFPHTKPLATESVKPIGVVEALALNACDLESIYIQPHVKNKEKPRHKRMIKEELERNIDELICRNMIPEKLNQDVKSWSMREGDMDVYWNILDWDYLVSRLPLNFRNKIEGLTKLKEVPLLREIDEDVLKIICQKLEPMRYTESDNNFITQKGKPLDKMVYIVDGFVSIEERSSDDSRRGVGELCGLELLRWPFYLGFPHMTTPLATESVKAFGVVEALALNVQDLRSIYGQSDIKRKEEDRHGKMMKEEVKQHMNSWMRKNGIPERLNKDIKSRIMEKLSFDYWDTLPSDWYNLVSRLPVDFQNEIKRYMPLTKLKEMPKFQNMEESVLKQICSHLRPVKCYRDSGDIIQRGDPIQMFFVVDGHIFDPNDNKKGPGEICGEELLDWPFLTSFPRRVPRAVVSPRADRSPEVLVLTAVHMETIATEFRKHFIKNYGRLAQKLVNHASPAVTMPGPSSSEAVVRFTEEEIKEATSNYSCHNYENEGGYGAVYEAALPGSETPVAIKTSNSADIGNRFIQSQHLVHEAFVLSHIRHKNVVRLLGCCLETQWPIMVYDRTYARTLEEHIRLTGPKLLLQQRMNIAAETAGALAYLHSMSVTHRDVKTANILIDHTTHIAKLSGFGASRWLDDEVSTLAETQWLDDDDSTSPTLPGTTGYLDPEYLESQVLTEKSDVYSFGVVLVELLTSQAAVSSDRPERSLANVFLCSMQKGHLHQILDRKVFKDNFSFEIAEQVSKLAVTCLGPSGEERPSMEEVAAELDRVVKLL